MSENERCPRQAPTVASPAIVRHFRARPLLVDHPLEEKLGALPRVRRNESQSPAFRIRTRQPLDSGAVAAKLLRIAGVASELDERLEVEREREVVVGVAVERV